MTHITCTRFCAWICIETVHKSKLEFVLKDTAIRNDKDPDFYAEDLWDMMRHAIHEHGWEATERSGFGDELFLVEADTQRGLDKAMKICDGVVGEWKLKHSVDQMWEGT